MVSSNSATASALVNRFRGVRPCSPVGAIDGGKWLCQRATQPAAVFLNGIRRRDEPQVAMQLLLLSVATRPLSNDSWQSKPQAGCLSCFG